MRTLPFSVPLASEADNRDVSSPSDPQGSAAPQHAGAMAGWHRMTPGALKVLLVAITVLLLGSSGGVGVVASPVLLALQFLAARTSRRASEVLLWALLASATGLEAAWAITYLALGEAMPWIWLVPTLVGIAFGIIVFVGARRARLQ